MIKVKRCPFCGSKTDNKGFCTNKDCADYRRKELFNDNSTPKGRDKK